MSTTITIHVQGSVVGNEVAVRRLIVALSELVHEKDIHVEWVGEVGRATITPRARQAWQPRMYQRRQHPAPFAGPDRRSGHGGRRTTDLRLDRRQRRQSQYGVGYAGDYGGLRRSAWRGGRRSGDVHRERRSLGVPRRGPVVNPMFWLHQCRCAGYALSASAYLYTRFCPDCGLERTTFHDRRTGAAERRVA